MARSTRAEVVVCGAGIAGISAAYHLAVHRGVRDVALVDDHPPLTVTSDKSTECYRDWWPGPDDAMLRLMGRSIDLIEELADESGNAFAMHPAGYAYFTARPEVAREWEQAGRQVAEATGVGMTVRPARVRTESSANAIGPSVPWAGAELVLDRRLILERFPFLTEDVEAMLAPRRCGWLSAQQLGMLLLEKAREAGVELVRGRVAGVELTAGRISGVRLEESGIERIRCSTLVNAAGPLAGSLARQIGVELPVYCELHTKLTFADHLGVLPRHLPLMIWNDPIRLQWNEEERRELEADPDLSWLLDELPGGVHFRPEGGEGSQSLLLLWAYDVEPREPDLPPRFDPLYAQVVLRGIARMVPAFDVYLDRGRAPYVDGGYYCKTRDNRPLVGPSGPPGSYLLAALSGYGIMASQGAAELLAAQITGGALPEWGSAFSPGRFADPEYLERLASWDAASGQL